MLDLSPSKSNLVLLVVGLLIKKKNLKAHQDIKSNLHYARGITPRRVTNGGAHFSSLAPGQNSSQETFQRWRAVGDTASDLTDSKIKPHISRTDGDVLNTYNILDFKIKARKQKNDSSA